MSVINKINLKGTEYTIANSAMGTCSTEASTKDKVVNLSGFTWSSGVTIYVKFKEANTSYGTTLNVNGTGAYKIVSRGTSTLYGGVKWDAGDICSFTSTTADFDGTGSGTFIWVMTSSSSRTNEVFPDYSSTYCDLGKGDDDYYNIIGTMDGTDRLHSAVQFNPTAGVFDFRQDSTSGPYWQVKISGGLEFTYANNSYCRIMPPENNIGYIGTSSKKWYSIYSAAGYFTQLCPTSTSNCYLGLSSNKWSYAYINYLRPNSITLQSSSGSILPYNTSSNTCTIGSSSYQFSSIYAKNYYESGTLLSNKYVQGVANTTSQSQPKIMKTITASDYSSLTSKDANTLYIII